MRTTTFTMHKIGIALVLGLLIALAGSMAPASAQTSTTAQTQVHRTALDAKKISGVAKYCKSHKSQCVAAVSYCKSHRKQCAAVIKYCTKHQCFPPPCHGYYCWKASAKPAKVSKHAKTASFALRSASTSTPSGPGGSADLVALLGLGLVVSGATSVAVNRRRLRRSEH